MFIDVTTCESNEYGMHITDIKRFADRMDAEDYIAEHDMIITSVQSHFNDNAHMIKVDIFCKERPKR